LVDWLTAMVLHQSYSAQYHSFFTLISYYDIVFSFALMFPDGWFTWYAMVFCIASAYYLSHMKQ